MTSSLLARSGAFALAAVWVVACADARVERARTRRVETPPPATPAVTASVIPSAPVRDECFGTDTTEMSAMACAAGAVSRIADTLQVLLSSGRVVRRVDVPSGGADNREYRYEGRIGGSSGGPAYHVLILHRFESGGEELINAQTGDSLFVRGRPLISPDGARFAVSDMSGLEMGEGHVVLQVWRITGDRAINELDLAPYDFAEDRGWGPSQVAWRAADTISLVRNIVPRDSARRRNSDWDTTRSLLAHKASGWVLDPRR